MGNIIPVTLKLGKSAAGADYPLTLSWFEDGARQSVEDQVPKSLKIPGHEGADYAGYRAAFLAGGSKKAFRDIGLHLHGVLHTGRVGEKLDELKKNKAAGDSLRILLEVEEPDGVEEPNPALLPWELIFNGREAPFQETDDTIVRVASYADDASPLAEPVSWPLRLLIVVGVDDKKIRALEEVERIEDAIRPLRWLIDVELREQPDINELRTVCKEKFRPHVFHYIGHGGVTGTGDPYVMLKSPAGGAGDTWTSRQIKTSLKAWGWAPRFAFLNACRTAVGAADSDENKLKNQKSAWDVGSAFRSLGVPAVLSMQADVDGGLAGRFAGALYESLAAGDPVDRAAAVARTVMRDNTVAQNKDLVRDWATPTLTLSAPPEKVLPLWLGPRCAKTRKQIEQDIERCELFREVSVLADRRTDRRLFIHGLYPIPPQEPDKELICVHGSKEMGKTWMTLWCLESYARRGHDVRYVEVVGPDSSKWLDVLLHIQKGDPSKVKIAGQYPLIFRPLAPEAFHEFNHDLPYRLNNDTPPDWQGQAVPPPEGLDTSKLDTLPVKTAEEIFKSFRKALVNAAEPDNPLVIVLDKFTYERRGLPEAHLNKFLMPYLFERAAVGELKARDGERTRSVKLVVVMSDDEIDFYTRGDAEARATLDELRNYAHEVRLEGIPAEQFAKVAWEFFRNLKAAPPKIQGKLKNSTQEDAEYTINRIRAKLPDPWSPLALKTMRTVLESLEDLAP